MFDWAGLQNKFTPALKFARAGLYLSDYAELGDTNACLLAVYVEEFGDGPFVLSEATPKPAKGSSANILATSSSSSKSTNASNARPLPSKPRLAAATCWASNEKASLVPTQRANAFLAYDDVSSFRSRGCRNGCRFRTSQSNTRAHTTGARSASSLQSDQWQDATSTWGSDATELGKPSPVTSTPGHWRRLDVGPWETGEYFEQGDHDTWSNTYA